MNTIQLECFLAVAQYLNFSKAAEDIRITQPAVSHQISSLEEELGVKLFTRTSKNVSLTPEGVLFLPDADNILKIAHSASERLGSREKPILLDIGCQGSLEASLLPAALKALKQEYPNLRPIIHLVPFETLASFLEAGKLHAVLGLKNDRKKTALQYLELFQCPVVCICSKNSSLSRFNTLNTGQLEGPAVLCEPHKTPEVIFRLQTETTSGMPGSQRYVGDSAESVLTLVKAEFGYTLLPDISPSRDPELSYIPMTDFRPLSFGVYYRSADENNILKRFCRLLKDIHAIS